MRHLVIAGGGHAHLHVLRSLAMHRQAGLRLTVISPSPYSTYTGMVPGVIAGQYRLAEAMIDVRTLASRAGAAFVADRVVRIRPESRMLELESDPPLAYDLLSIDIGSRPAGADRVAEGTPVIMVKPIEGIATNIDKVLATAGPAVSRRVVIVGAGAGGTEISFALAARFRGQGRCAINLCDAAAAPAAERGPKTSRLVLAALRRHGIEFLGGSAVERADADGVHLAGGRVLAATLIIWAAGAAGPELFAASELPVDERGFLQVGNDLRCDRYPEIFAAGDCATLASYPSLPKAGVHAVRQGPVLADNLCAAATDAVSKPYRPQKRFLALLNTGDGRAILSYGGWAARGRWAWWLKDYIDRKFVAKYAPSSLGK